jgi:undecaprenyl-diphosphatase
MSIPIMFGASGLKLLKFGFHYTSAELIILLVGSVVSFFVSLIVIKFLLSYLKRNDFQAFGWYRIILGIIVLASSFFLK